MGLIIGRCGVDVALDNPIEFAQSGTSQIRLTGELWADSVAECKVLRQQLAGHVGTVQPVTWTEDPSVDGFYRIVSARIVNRPLSLSVGTFDFDATIEKVPHGQTPGFAMISVQPQRNNTPGGVTEQPWVGIPASRVSWDVGADAVVYWYSRTGPGGEVYYHQSTSQLDDGRPRGQLDPADWFDMSPKMTLGGYVVTGTQVPALTELGTWTVDNGLIRFSNTATSGSLFMVQFPDVDGDGEWNDDHDLEIGYWDGSTWRTQTNLVGWKIFRNDAEEVHWRQILGVDHPTNDLTWELYVDTRLRRGALYAEVHVSAGRALKYGIKAVDVGATNATAWSTYGFYQTADDADGNRILVVTPETLENGSSELADGWAYLATAARRIVMGVGCNLDGNSASTPDQHTDVRDQFFASGGVRLAIGA